MKKTTKKTAVKTAKPKTEKAAKAAPAKKTTSVKKTAVKPVEAEKEAAIKAAAKKTTRVVACINVGWGHSLYIRGEGAGLSWEQGVPMICSKDGKEWHWVAETDHSPITFKVLVDDKTWAVGENVVINAGDIHLSEPKF